MKGLEGFADLPKPKRVSERKKGILRMTGQAGVSPATPTITIHPSLCFNRARCQKPIRGQGNLPAGRGRADASALPR